MKMIRSPISSKKKLFISVSSVVLLIAGYLILAEHQYSVNPDNTMIPTLKGFIEGFVNIFKPRGKGGNVSIMNSWFILDFTSTAYRLFISLFISICIGILLGVFMGCFTVIEAFFNWPISFFSKVTPTGAMSVFFIMFGTDIQMFVAMVVFGITPAIAISIMLSIKSMPEQYIHKGYTLGGSTGESVFTIVGRYVLPNIIDTVRLCIGPAIIYLIAAESLCADTGFGHTIRQEAKLTHMNVVFIYLAILAAFGFLADWGLKAIQRKACSWYGGSR